MEKELKPPVLTGDELQICSSELINLWRKRATTLHYCAELVKSNHELSKALAWMGDAFEQCADELSRPQTSHS